MGRIDHKKALKARVRRPAPFWDAWEEIRKRIGEREQVVLLADFDGTLAHITDFPRQASLPEQVRRLLSAISKRGAVVGVVSGRELDDIRSRVGVKGIWYVGTHGFSLYSPSGKTVHLASPIQRRTVARVAKRLNRRLRDRKGVVVESKDVAVAVHYRRASPEDAAEAIAAARDMERETPRLRSLSGKKVVELLPATRITKWTAARRILEQNGERSGEHFARHGLEGNGTGRNGVRRDAHAERPLIFYLGDDKTDEAVFERLDGISIAVGKSGNTHARYFLESPEQVERFLGCVLEALS